MAMFRFRWELDMLVLAREWKYTLNYSAFFYVRYVSDSLEITRQHRPTFLKGWPCFHSIQRLCTQRKGRECVLEEDPRPTIAVPELICSFHCGTIFEADSFPALR